MARHAGFAVALTVAEAYLNQTLWAAIADLGPLSVSRIFRLPGVAPLPGGGSVRISGLALFESRPRIQLKPNPGNTVGMTVTATAYASVNTDIAAPIDQDQTWKLRLSAQANAAIDVEVDPKGLFLRWQPAQSTIGNIRVSALEGPGIPQFLVDAVNSPAMRAALNGALQSLGPIRLSQALYPSRLEHVQSCDLPSTSLFEWFRIRAQVSRAVLKVLDGVVAVGIDLSGFSAGDPNALIDLRRQVGDGAIYRSQEGTPLLVPYGGKQDDGDIAVLVNAQVLSAIVADISRQIQGTLVVPFVRIGSISLTPRWFDKPLRGREIGLCFELTLRNETLGDVSGRIFFQPFVVNGQGSRPDHWRIYPGKVEIDVPWWAHGIALYLATGLSLALPWLAPLWAVGVVTAIDGLIPFAVSLGQNAVIDEIGRNGRGVAPGLRHGNLPTRLRQNTIEGVSRIKVNSDGVSIHMTQVAASLRFADADETIDTGSLAAELEAGSPEPYDFNLRLRADLAGLADDCSASIIVRRADTGQEVARSEGPYNLSRRLLMDHMTPELYFVDDYIVQARIFLNRASLSGTLFATTQRLRVTDILDRRRPFAYWPDHVAYFRNPFDPTRFWARGTTHKIHRTAASARCLGLRQRIERMRHKPHMSIGYRDDLGFDFADVHQHKDRLCDYCFFGRPNGPRAFPREDWFKR